MVLCLETHIIVSVKGCYFISGLSQRMFLQLTRNLKQHEAEPSQLRVRNCQDHTGER